MSHQPSAIAPDGGPPSGADRGWSRRMLFWSAALAALLVLLALGGANWRAFHLLYCRRLLAAADDRDQLRGIEMVGRTHLRVGLARGEVERLFAPLRVMDGSAEEPPTVHPAGLDDGLALEFDADGRLVRWWTRP